LRSKFAELLAEKSSYKPKKHELALVGLFSMIDVLLQKPLDTIFSQLRISDEVQMAIKLDSKSELFPIYKLVIDYEMGNWEEIDKDIKSLKILRNIPDIYIQAVKTTDDIVKFIKE
jgi:EAL and modified HD-GYP domain-containing signal transduction protein